MEDRPQLNAATVPANLGGLGQTQVRTPQSVSVLTAVYSDCVFGDAGRYTLVLDLHRRYARTLLLTPDIPWVADGPQRDGEAVRARVHTRLQRALAHAGLPYTCIVGDAAQRLRTAMEAVNG